MARLLYQYDAGTDRCTIYTSIGESLMLVDDLIIGMATGRVIQEAIREAEKNAYRAGVDDAMRKVRELL